MKAAYRRAQHFTPKECEGQFTCLHSPIGRNYADALSVEEDPFAQLIIQSQWSKGLNRLAQQTRVMDGVDLRYAFASFKHALWIDPKVLG